MSWQILIIIYVVFYSVAILFQRVLLKEDESDPVAYSIFFQFLIGILIGGFGILMGGISFPNNIIKFIPNLVISTLLYTLTNIFIFKALKIMQVSIFSVFLSSRVVFTFLASSLILGESLTIKQSLGGFLIFIGVILVSLRSKKFSFGRGELFALLGAVTLGFAITNDRFLLQYFNLYSYTFIDFLLPAFFMLLIFPKSLPKMKIFLKTNTMLKILVCSILFAASTLVFFAALQIGENSSQVVAASLTSVIGAVLLAVVFLKERDNLLNKALGAAISFAGLLFLTL